MSTADMLLAGVWNRLTHDWERVATFRQMGLLGEDTAREAIHRNHEYFVQRRLLNGELQKLLKDRDGFVSSGLAERLPGEMTESAVSNYRRTLHASTLVFAHSILDAAMYDCLRICAEEGLEEWGKLLENRRVSLAEVSSKSLIQLVGAVVTQELDRVERESLLAKTDLLFQLCKPTRAEILTNGFRFDRARLQSLDQLRHKVVHAPDAEWSFSGIYDDLEFMRNCGLHVFSMVGVRFGLVFSGREAAEALAQRGKAGRET
jgi:hypothetical protein